MTRSRRRSARAFACRSAAEHDDAGRNYSISVFSLSGALLWLTCFSSRWNRHREVGMRARRILPSRHPRIIVVKGSACRHRRNHGAAAASARASNVRPAHVVVGVRTTRLELHVHGVVAVGGSALSRLDARTWSRSRDERCSARELLTGLHLRATRYGGQVGGQERLASKARLDRPRLFVAGVASHSASSTGAIDQTAGVLATAVRDCRRTAARRRSCSPSAGSARLRPAYRIARLGFPTRQRARRARCSASP